MRNLKGPLKYFSKKKDDGIRRVASIYHSLRFVHKTSTWQTLEIYLRLMDFGEGHYNLDATVYEQTVK